MNELKKAKTTIYKHKNWYIGGTKTVYDAIFEMKKSGDFYLDTTLRYYPINAPRENFIEWLIEQGRYNDIVIRYKGREGGTDRGILKIKTWIEINEN